MDIKFPKWVARADEQWTGFCLLNCYLQHLAHKIADIQSVLLNTWLSELRTTVRQLILLWHRWCCWWDCFFSPYLYSCVYFSGRLAANVSILLTQEYVSLYRRDYPFVCILSAKCYTLQTIKKAWCKSRIGSIITWAPRTRKWFDLRVYIYGTVDGQIIISRALWAVRALDFLPALMKENVYFLLRKWIGVGNTVLTNSIALIQSSIWPDDRFLRRSPERCTCYTNLAAIARCVDREAMACRKHTLSSGIKRH